MNVVFWSPVHGHGAVSTNMACMSIISSLAYCLKVVSFQSGYADNNLDMSLIGENSNDNNELLGEEFPFYCGRSIDSLLWDGINNNVNDNVADYAVEIINGLNYYLPSTEKNNEELYNQRFINNIDNVIASCQRCFDVTFIDNQSDNTYIQEKLCNSADIIAVNMYQNPLMIANTIEKCSLLNKKVFYMIGRYNDNSDLNIRSIIKKYNISRDDIGVIPYNKHLMDAINSGKTKDFIKNNISCMRRNSNYELISQMKISANRLLRKAGVIDG